MSIDAKTLQIFKTLGILMTGSESACPRVDLAGAHVLPDRFPLHDYVAPACADPYDPRLNAPKLFSLLPPGASVSEALAATRLLVFIGAVGSPELERALEEQNALKIVVDPDQERMGAFLAAKGPKAFAGRNILFFAGDPDSFAPPLLMQLPSELCTFGAPAVFAAPELTEACPDMVERIARTFEIYFFRCVIYPISGQDYARSKPIRTMKREAIYDRVKHAYENLTPCLRAGTLDDLRDGLSGEKAILVAAGPALDDRLEWLREHRDSGVVIAVNNAIKPLLAAGIEPDFCVINDTSLAAGKAFEGLPHLEHCRLVPHCLSSMGGEIFEHIHVFGNVTGQPFPERDSLLLHGSVITTAFSLAEYLGCTKAILVGLQLASLNPKILNYSRGSQHGDLPTEWKKPQGKTYLVPVKAANGDQMYTSLNFLDVAYWFRDRIRMGALEVVNTEPGTILYGDPIVIDPDPQLPVASGLRERVEALPLTPPDVSVARVRDYAVNELTKWRAMRKACRIILEGIPAPNQIADAVTLIHRFDNDNTSYMLERFESFDNAHFHRLYFTPESNEDKIAGIEYYFTHLERMAQTLFGILKEQVDRLVAMERS